MPSALLAGALTLLLLFAGTAAHASRAGTVILSGQECGYIMLNTGQGQVLLKLIRGEAPKPGDRLEASGPLPTSDFADLTNRRTQEPLTVWVDMVDRSSNRALGRYGQYCN
ncbi:hypothetical protein [Isoalcanivorax indicus]|uniref:hypothetical protein n=1 Tax=Isoalcanivorax indicus TaxID=2202653 RepID=UPI000DB9AA27|nr:hypothetical protein [Isoalcanivorax indicus]